MVNLNKNKVLIIATATVFSILIISLSCVYAAEISVETDPTRIIRNLGAKGIALQKIEDGTEKTPASFVLSLTPAEPDQNVKKFSVTGGTFELNGVTFAMAGGDGVVLTGRRFIFLKATGTDADGNKVNLKLAGRYFWMGGHLFVARMIEKLETEQANYLLLMRAAIRV